MPKPLDFALLSTRFRQHLISRGPQSATEIAEALRISQPSFSRLVEKLSADLLVIGKARNTRYALSRNVLPIGTQTPLYLVTESGKPVQLGILHFVESRGFFLAPQQLVELEARHFSDLPYFLDDLRPSGFLGRLVPRAHPELGAPADILKWSAEDCLRYWTSWGWNLVGNLLLGQRALQLFLERLQARASVPGVPIPHESFPDLALHVLRNWDAGSSAGGEQPKFSLEATASEPAALVKFSPPLQEQVGRRVADLLICEHHCHELLAAYGVASAKSSILEIGEQVFLRVERFDRVGEFGRRGVISLRALSMEYVGTLESWSQISFGLWKRGKIDRETHEKTRKLEMFGQLIGNTDMHAGNLSFFLNQDLKIGSLAPVYDMLPMQYYPRQNQLPVDAAYSPRLPPPEDAAIWRSAADLALRLWERVGKDDRVSRAFREIAEQNHRILREQIRLASQLFGT